MWGREVELRRKQETCVKKEDKNNERLQRKKDNEEDTCMIDKRESTVITLLPLLTTC